MDFGTSRLFGRRAALLEEDKPRIEAGPPPAPPPAQPAPFAVFPDAESFNKRVARETKKALAELGITDPDAVKGALEKAAALEKANEEAKRAQMSETERLRSEKAQADADRARAMSDAEEARMRASLFRKFAEKGVRNFDYGFFKVSSKLAEMGDDEELDVPAYLDELAKDPTQAAALGFVVAAPPPPPAAPTPANTAPRPPGAPPPPAPLANGAPGPKTAFEMNGDEWTRRKAQLGI